MVLNLDIWLTVLVDDVKREVLDILLYFRIGEFTTDETLDVKDTGEAITILTNRLVRRQRVGNLCVIWARCCSVFRSVANEVFGVRESNIRWGCPVSVVVGDNIDLTVLPDTDTTLWEEMSAYEDRTPATGDR